MLGNINRAMDRTHDNLHRVQNHSGVSRISRTPPTGPRGAGGRHPRNANGRASNLAAGLANMAAGFGGPGAMNPVMNGMPPMNGNFMMGNGQTELLAMMEQQGRMIQEMQNQLMFQHQNGGNNRGGGHNARGRSLFERTSRPQGNRRGGAQHQFNNQSETKTEADGQSEDVDMGQGKAESANPEETVCKWNLRCTNKECKFAHQSPAAPPGVTVDVKDVYVRGGLQEPQVWWAPPVSGGQSRTPERAGLQNSSRTAPTRTAHSGTRLCRRAARRGVQDFQLQVHPRQDALQVPTLPESQLPIHPRGGAEGGVPRQGLDF